MVEVENKNNLKFIFGKRIKDQARFLREARKESSRWKKIQLDKSHYDYLLAFFKKNYLLILGLLALLFSSGVVETTLLVASRNQLIGQSKIFIVNYLWWFFLIFIFLFLTISYLSIKYERSIIVILANSIRQRLFRSYINSPLDSASDYDQANLIAKISYHLPLVSMGVANTFFGLWRWLIYLAITLVIATLANVSILIVGVCFIGSSFILYLSSYFLAKFYISQEVTFYSKIIKEVDFNYSNIKFLKIFGQENEVFKKFDKLVWFDSFFRVKRDILLRIGFKVVFALLIIVSVLSHFFSKNFFSFIGLVGSANGLFFLFLIIYFSRALAESVKIGLYLFPARLGLFLTILKPGRILARRHGFNLKDQKNIVFYSNKTKLFKEDHYHRNLRFVFSKGERILFTGENLLGKTSLAKLFSGLGAYNQAAVKVLVGNQRLEYVAWEKMCIGTYFFDPNIRTDRSLMEYIIGKINENISMEEVERALKIINQYPEIAKLVSSNGNYNVEASFVLDNPVRAFALHFLHCLVNDYYLIVIDNFWLDLNYPIIIDINDLLSNVFSESIIIVFARNNNTKIKYSQKYEISKEKISKK